MIEVLFTTGELPASGALALLVPEGGLSGGLWAEIDEASGGQAGRAAAAAQFSGRKGQTATVLAPTAGLSRLVLVGLGKDPLSPRALEEAGGAAAPLLQHDEHAAIGSQAGGIDLAYAAVGAVLRSYRFDLYRTKQKPEDKPALTQLVVLSPDPAASEAVWRRQAPVIEGAFVTRDLVSEPANILTPAEMADRAAKLAELGLDIEILGPGELAALKFGALLGVAQGSRQPPRVVILRWNGAGGETAPLLFVGKGVTFDSGGISIKPAAGMEDMKWDMGGAGTVIGLMAALAGRAAKVDAIGIVGLVENMPDGNAQRPGDVVTSHSGQTLEVINTDAEGRLVLADVIWYAQERFKPRVTIDLATLTGAVIVALGHEFAGVFSNDAELPCKLIDAGAAVGEKLWHLPLDDNFDKAIKSDIADMKNVGGRPAGACTAAQFIKRFVNKTPWAHLDIAGMAWADKDTATVPKGATAYGVRLLDEFVARYYE